MAKRASAGRTAIAPTPTHKTCTDCRRDVPVELMKRASRTKIASICKQCDSKRGKDRYWKDPEGSRRRRRASWWGNLESNRARGRRYARSKRGRVLNRAAVARWRGKNAEKVKAQRALQRAIRRGQIVKPTECQVRECTLPANHGHHPRYDRPLDAVFVCTNHHEHVHHVGALKLKDGLKRRFARPPSPPTRPDLRKSPHQAAFS